MPSCTLKPSSKVLPLGGSPSVPSVATAIEQSLNVLEDSMAFGILSLFVSHDIEGYSERNKRYKAIVGVAQKLDKSETNNFIQLTYSESRYFLLIAFGLNYQV